MLLGGQGVQLSLRRVSCFARVLGSLAFAVELGGRGAQPLGRALDRGLRLAKRIGALAHGRARVCAVGPLMEATHALAHITQPDEPALERLELLQSSSQLSHQRRVDLGQPDA